MGESRDGSARRHRRPRRGPRRDGEPLSYSVDVNLLLYASDASGPEHARAAAFLAERAADAELWCVAWVTLMGYMRMATHPSIFAAPLSHDEAAANVDGLLALPQVRVIDEGAGFWARYRDVAQEVPVRGNLVPDAHLVAILRQHGVRTIYTRDRDFRKWSGLDVVDPLDGRPTAPRPRPS